MPATKRAPQRWTYQEIADHYGKSRSTVVNTWANRDGWPDPIARRGAALEFDAAAVERFYAKHFRSAAPTLEGDDDELITLTEMAALTGYGRKSLGSMVTRGTWPAPVGRRRMTGTDGTPTEVWERYWRLGDARTELERRGRSGTPE